MAPPVRLAHVVFRTSDLPRLRDFYLTLLEGHVSFENKYLCFVTYDDEHHRVAMIRDRSLPARPEKTNFEHVAFTYADLPTLLDTHSRLLEHKISPYWTVNHGPTTSFYYRDPDGNSVELQIDNYSSHSELHDFFHSAEFAENPVGVDIAVDDLRRRLAEGESERQILLRSDVH